jgi:DNA polymerase-3 subunit epsilon
MILVFDTETTGFVDFRMPPDHACQPHIVQLAAILIDDAGAERASMCVVVKPDGYTIPEKASAIHGITTEIASRVGIPLGAALHPFANLRSLASLVVAHNLDFDEAVIDTAFARQGLTAISPPERFCTMKAATPICKIPHANPRSETDYKWPKLVECMRHFFDEGHAGAHDALADVRATSRVYFALKALQ